MCNNIENSIEGYKYLVCLSIYFDEDSEYPYEINDYNQNICICDTRDKAISIINQDIENNIGCNKKYMVTAEPYNITRLGGIVKWKNEKGKKWMWEYSICPIKYVTN